MQYSPIRIVLVDAHMLVREGLRLLIESKPGMCVVGQAGTPEQALQVARQTQPDIILLELNLGDSTVEFISELLGAAKTARVILVTGILDATLQYHAIQLGVVGIVFKDQSSDILGKAILKVHEGQAWLDRSTMAKVLTRISQARSEVTPLKEQDPKIKLLSPRELEVIKLLCNGLKNNDIAAKLSISETTVRHHLTSIFAKLQVSNRLELLVYAYRHHLGETLR